MDYFNTDDFTNPKYDYILNDEGVDIPEFIVNVFDDIKDDIVSVLSNNAPRYRSIGLVDTAISCKSLEANLLRKIICNIYSTSSETLDMFSVGLAYIYGGYHYRQSAVEYIEKSIDHIDFHEIRRYIYLFPLSVYNKTSDLYDMVEEYAKAIVFAEKAKLYTEFESAKAHFDKKIAELKTKQETPPVKNHFNISKHWQEYEDRCFECANYLIDRWNLRSVFLVVDTYNYLPETFFAKLVQPGKTSIIKVFINPERETIDFMETNTRHTFSIPFIKFLYMINSINGDCNIFYSDNQFERAVFLKETRYNIVQQFKLSLFPIVDNARMTYRQNPINK